MKAYVVMPDSLSPVPVKKVRREGAPANQGRIHYLVLSAITGSWVTYCGRLRGPFEIVPEDWEITCVTCLKGALLLSS